MALPAQAQYACNSYENMRAKLGVLKEVPNGFGVGPFGRSVVEFYVSKKGDFTVLSIQPNGRTCVEIHGKNWTWIEVKPGHPT